MFRFFMTLSSISSCWRNQGLSSLHLVPGLYNQVNHNAWHTSTFGSLTLF